MAPFLPPRQKRSINCSNQSAVKKTPCPEKNKAERFLFRDHLLQPGIRLTDQRFRLFPADTVIRNGNRRIRRTIGADLLLSGFEITLQHHPFDSGFAGFDLVQNILKNGVLTHYDGDRELDSLVKALSDE